MDYIELKIAIDMYGAENVIPKVGGSWYNVKTKNDRYDIWTVVCNDGDCHFFDYYNYRELDISTITRKINGFTFGVTDEIRSSMKKVVIPDNIKEIGSDTFKDCKNLTEVVIPNSVNKICSGAFIHCRSLESIVIPDSVRTIDYICFANCDSLKSLPIGKNVTKIQGIMFYGCNGLIDIEIPQHVKKIEHEAFSSCKNLERVVIPSTVETIDEDVFIGCDKLKEIVFKGFTPKQIANKLKCRKFLLHKKQSLFKIER